MKPIMLSPKNAVICIAAVAVANCLAIYFFNAGKMFLSGYRRANNSVDFRLTYSGDTAELLEVDLRVLVLTHKRPASLVKLLRSLDDLEMDGDRALLEIWIDPDAGSNLADPETIRTAESFNWTRGRKLVRVHRKHVGIVGQWIDTWTPSDPASREISLILEDDVSVSPFAYRWLKAVHGEYGRRSDFVGATLSSDELSVLGTNSRTSRLAAPAHDTVFMYKCFGSHGFSPKLRHWISFRRWYHSHKPSVAPHFRPYVPGALPTVWYKQFEKQGLADSMWTIWLIYYMHVEQLYAVYSNLGVYAGNGRSCLSINRREVGLHTPRKGREDLCRLLMTWKDEFVKFPASVVRLDWDGQQIPSDLLY